MMAISKPPSLAMGVPPLKPVLNAPLVTGNPFPKAIPPA